MFQPLPLEGGHSRYRGTSGEPTSWILAPLQEQGYAVVRLSREEWLLIDALFRRSRDFFSCEKPYKESFKFFPLPGGYMTPYPGTFEIFELRRGFLRCPEELAGEAMGAFRLLERLALGICAEIGRDIGIDLAAMVADGSPAMRCIHYDRPYANEGSGDAAAAPSGPVPVGSTVRVVGLGGADAALNGMTGAVQASDAGEVVVALSSVPEVVISARGGGRSARVPASHVRVVNPRVPGIYPAHTDSALITIAPRSSIAGLEAKDLRTGEWWRIEEIMGPDECLVFVGDPLDYASLHRYPAFMHRATMPCEGPRPGRGAGGRAAHRVSTPFFLYPRDSAVLSPKSLPSVVFDDLNGNVDNCRDRFPWKKQSCYYSDLVYSENAPEGA